MAAAGSGSDVGASTAAAAAAAAAAASAARTDGQRPFSRVLLVYHSARFGALVLMYAQVVANISRAQACMCVLCSCNGIDGSSVHSHVCVRFADHTWACAYFICICACKRASVGEK